MLKCIQHDTKHDISLLDLRSTLKLYSAMSIEIIIAAAPTPTPATVGQSVPVTGIGLGVETDVAKGVAVPIAVGLAVADPQLQFVLNVHKGFLQKPPEQIKLESQLLLDPHVPLQELGAAVAVGEGLGVGVAVGVGVGVAAQAVISVVQAAPTAGQQN